MDLAEEPKKGQAWTLAPELCRQSHSSSANPSLQQGGSGAASSFSPEFRQLPRVWLRGCCRPGRSSDRSESWHLLVFELGVKRGPSQHRREGGAVLASIL